MGPHRTVTALVCLLLASACTSLPPEHNAQTERLDSFEQKVMLAKSIAGVEEKTVVLVTSEGEGGYRLSNLAWTNTYSVSGDKRIYAVHIDPLFLSKGPDILLEHVAQHEVCHLRNNDLRRLAPPGENIELRVEHCVRLLVGVDRYRRYVESYRAWRPNTPELEQARQGVMSNLAVD